MTGPVLVVLGAGPGVGAAVARRFGRGGFDVALVARSADKLEALAEQLRAEGFAAGWRSADLTDPEALTAAVTGLGQSAGRINVLHFNPSATTLKGPLDLSAEQLLTDVALGVASLLTAVQAARRFMGPGARITATGSMSADQPWAEAASVGVQKAGMRNLVGAIDATLRAEGIRAMSLTVRGAVALGTAFDPSRIADAIYAAATAPDEDWRTEVPFDG